MMLQIQEGERMIPQMSRTGRLATTMIMPMTLQLATMWHVAATIWSMVWTRDDDLSPLGDEQTLTKSTWSENNA